MDALLILLGGGLVATVLWSWLARGHRPPPAGAARASRGLRSAREIVESREALEAEDLAQLHAAVDARRRRRGQPGRTLEEVELAVAREAGALSARREASLAERDLDQLLEATNARRRARGLPERSREDVRRQFGAA